MKSGTLTCNACGAPKQIALWEGGVCEYCWTHNREPELKIPAKTLKERQRIGKRLKIKKMSYQAIADAFGITKTQAYRELRYV